MNAIRQLILMTAMVILSVSPGFAADYVYDDLSRLTEVNYGNGQGVIRYAYDATGNRIGMQIESDIPPEPAGAVEPYNVSSYGSAAMWGMQNGITYITHDEHFVDVTGRDFQRKDTSFLKDRHVGAE